MGFWPGLGRPLHRLLRAGPPLAAPTSPLLSEVLTRGPGSARSFLVVHKLGRSEHASLSPGFPAPEAAAQASHALPAGLTLRPRMPVPAGAGAWGPAQRRRGPSRWTARARGRPRAGGFLCRVPAGAPRPPFSTCSLCCGPFPCRKEKRGPREACGRESGELEQTGRGACGSGGS